MKPLLQDERRIRRRELVSASRRKKEEKRQNSLQRVNRYKESVLNNSIPDELSATVVDGDDDGDFI